MMFKKWVALFLAVVVLFAVLLYAGAAQFAGDVAAAPLTVAYREPGLAALPVARGTRRS